MARIVARARILIKIDEGWKVPKVAAVLGVSEGKVCRVKRRYAEPGLDGVLHDRVPANRFRKLDQKGEAHLIALACSDAPEGHDQWTLQLLADRMVELGLAECLSYETVRLRPEKHPQALAKTPVIHRANERGVCGGHGGRAGPLCEPYDPSQPVV